MMRPEDDGDATCATEGCTVTVNLWDYPEALLDCGHVICDRCETCDDCTPPTATQLVAASKAATRLEQATRLQAALTKAGHR